MKTSEKILEIKEEIRETTESLKKSVEYIETYRQRITFEEGQVERKQGEIGQRTAELAALEWIEVHQNDEWEGKQEFAEFVENPVLRLCKGIVYARTANWGCGCTRKDLKNDVRSGIIRLCQKYGYKVVLMGPDYCGWQMPIIGLVEYIHLSPTPDWYDSESGDPNTLL